MQDTKRLLQPLLTRGIFTEAQFAQGQRVITLPFTLRNGEQFCDRAITRAIELCGAVGALKEEINRFTIHQSTEVFVKGEWIPYATYLARQHGLNM